jgi:hypothetical protein
VKKCLREIPCFYGISRASTGYPVKANGISRDFMFTGNPVGLPRDIPLAFYGKSRDFMFTGNPVGLPRDIPSAYSGNPVKQPTCPGLEELLHGTSRGQDMKRAQPQAAAAPRTVPAQPRRAAKSTPGSASSDGASSTDPPATKKPRKGVNNEGALEHADAASFVLAGESSLSGATFAAIYPPANWGNPGAIQDSKVYVSVPVW